MGGGPRIDDDEGIEGREEEGGGEGRTQESKREPAPLSGCYPHIRQRGI